MSVVYGIITEHYTLQDHTRTSYGIAAYSDAAECGTATILASVRDITSDREPLQKLIDHCNQLAVSPEHLRDVVEDFLLTQAWII